MWIDHFRPGTIEEAAMLCLAGAVELFYGGDHIRAKVRDGGKLFDVDIKLSGDKLEGANCACGARDGLCKHTAAVLLQRESFSIGKEVTPIAEAPRDDIKDIFDELDKEDLWEFLNDAFEEYPTLSEFFRQYFGEDFEGDLDELLLSYDVITTDEEEEMLKADLLSLMDDIVPVALDGQLTDLAYFFEYLDEKISVMEDGRDLSSVVRAVIERGEEVSRKAKEGKTYLVLLMSLLQSGGMAYYYPALYEVLFNDGRTLAEKEMLLGFLDKVINLCTDYQERRLLFSYKAKLSTTLRSAHAKDVLEECSRLSGTKPKEALDKLSKAIFEATGDEEAILLKGKIDLLHSMKRYTDEAAAIYDYMMNGEGDMSYAKRLKELCGKSGVWQEYKTLLKSKFSEDMWYSFLYESGERKELIAALEDEASLDTVAKYSGKLGKDGLEVAFRALERVLGKSSGRQAYSACAVYLRNLTSVFPGSDGKVKEEYDAILAKYSKKSALRDEFSKAFQGL